MCISVVATTQPIQAFLDQLGRVVWPDPHRAHDPLVLHWLANLGFEALLTDFATPSPGTALAACTAHPPASRVDLKLANINWENFWRGKMSLKDLFREHGNKIAMVVPERQNFTTTLIALLQRNLMPMSMKRSNEQGQDSHLCTLPVYVCECRHGMADLCIIHSGKAHLCFQGFQGMARLSMVQGCQFTLVLKDSTLYIVYSCNFLVTPQDWRLGLLINVSKFPLDKDNQELTQLGLLMSNLDFLKAPLWPFITEMQS
jgi:hypothetical protein